jgi:NAD(P)-dependent dehydrogenase (short-subunit alcohol dehydrogenase family)
MLTGKVALVTGAGSGIGRAAAIKLADDGCRVACVLYGEDENDVVAEIRGRGGEAMEAVADVADAQQVRRAVGQITDAWQTIDIVFANAGVNGVWAPLDELAPEEWTRTLAVNLTGTFLTVRYALPALKRQGGSVIINASVNGTRVFSNAGATAYACSKAGQVAFTKMTALELAKHKIRVNAICPGAIETPILQKTEQRELEEAQEPVEFPAGSIPLTDGRPGTPEQVADLVCFLAGDAASHITGSVIFIDGGESLLQG